MNRFCSMKTRRFCAQAIAAAVLSFAASVDAAAQGLAAGCGDGNGQSRQRDMRVREYVKPVAVVLENGCVENSSHLLGGAEFCDTLPPRTPAHCTLTTSTGNVSAITLDFGRELHGGIRIGASYPSTARAKVRVRFGESVGETMADIGESGATNDHAVRDAVIEVPRLGALEFGQTGFRFARIELVTPGRLLLEEVRAVSVMRDMKLIGSFDSSDPLLNRIWETCVRTVHLCSQEYLWDGIKRDRLVWMGDTHPETKALIAAFGSGATVVPETLEYAAKTTPPDCWMSTIPNYTLWWVRNVAEWYRFTGDAQWVRGLGGYLSKTLDHMLANRNKDGKWGPDEGSAKNGNQFFLDHPSRDNPKAERAGSQGLAALAFDDAAELMRVCGDDHRAGIASAAARKLRMAPIDAAGSKQAAAMLSLGGICNPERMDAELLSRNGAAGTTTFFGYYMLEAMSAGGNDQGAIDLIRSYWGAMLDMGATSFWEDFDVAWTNGTAQIDEVPAPGHKDIHGANGRFCYTGYRNSLCHGWAAGPAAWLHAHVLGVTQLEPGGARYAIRPFLGDLEWAEGDVPTAKGILHVRHEKRPDGTVATSFKAPDGVKVEVGEAPYAFLRELACVHRPGLAIAGAKARADEFAFTDGCSVPDADFADFLHVSMGIENVRIGDGAIAISIDGKLRPREQRISVAKDGVRITAADRASARQALYHIEDLLSLRRGPFLAIGEETRRARFEHRITHSGWGIGVFPDAYLNRLAHAGFTDVTVFINGRDTTSGNRHIDVNDLIRRAEKYDIGVYLYANSGVFAHPSDPSGRESLEREFGGFAELYPKAKGVIFVGESCQFPSKDPRVQPVKWRDKDRSDPRPAAGWFPCSDYPEWLTAVKDAMRAKAPGLDIIFWTYNWGWAPEKDRLELVGNIPLDVTLMATLEMFETREKRNGISARGADYTLSFAGPGSYYASEAAAAAKRGLRLAAMSNTAGRTWDFGTAPYEPCPWQWKARNDVLVRENAEHGLTTIVESHHYGWYPSFVTELSKEAFCEGGIPFDRHIRAIAARDYGEENAGNALKAWKLWSDAIVDYVPTNINQYGPFRTGCAYPFVFGKNVVSRSELPVCRDFCQAVNICRYTFLVGTADQAITSRERTDIPYLKAEIELLDGMSAKFRDGAALFAAMGRAGERMSDLGRYLACVVETASNVRQAAIAHFSGDSAKMSAVVEAEDRNTAEALELVGRNSAFGWEPSMGYVGGADQIIWKRSRMGLPRYP